MCTHKNILFPCYVCYSQNIVIKQRLIITTFYTWIVTLFVSDEGSLTLHDSSQNTVAIVCTYLLIWTCRYSRVFPNFTENQQPSLPKLFLFTEVYRQFFIASWDQKFWLLVNILAFHFLYCQYIIERDLRLWFGFKPFRYVLTPNGSYRRTNNMYRLNFKILDHELKFKQWK